MNDVSLPPFDTLEKDYFNDFDREDYTNFEMKINFGTEKNPNPSVVYFGETEFKKFTAEQFFAIIAANKDVPYELYYKDEKVSDIRFE